MNPLNYLKASFTLLLAVYGIVLARSAEPGLFTMKCMEFNR